MSAKYAQITYPQIRDLLIENKFEVLDIPGTKEIVFARSFHHDWLGDRVRLSLRVYTSVTANGVARDKGEDAIRVCLVYMGRDGVIHPLGSMKRVHRVEGWRANLQKRLDSWQADLIPHTCPTCGSPMKLIEPRGNQSWSAFYGCLHYKHGCDVTIKKED